MVTVFFPLIFGCSRMEWYRYYNECQPCKDGVYYSQCESDSFHLAIGWTMSLRMFGPPFVPLFPIVIGNSKYIDVFVESKIDSISFKTDTLEFALRSKGSNVLVRPTKVRKDGINTPTDLNRYEFYIGGDSPDTLEVVFLNKYHGCDLPIVTFIATKKTKYEPFVIPLDH
jgi:hypothetical protein